MATEEEREEFKQLQAHEFFDLVSAGVPELNAALEVGWTPRQLKARMADPDFEELVQSAQAQADGRVEAVLYQMSLRGNFQAIQMWLYNRQKSRWRDVKKIEIDTTVTHNVALVVTAKEAALAMLRERGPAQLQGFHQHAIETTADGG